MHHIYCIIDNFIKLRRWDDIVGYSYTVVLDYQSSMCGVNTKYSLPIVVTKRIAKMCIHRGRY